MLLSCQKKLTAKLVTKRESWRKRGDKCGVMGARDRDIDDELCVKYVTSGTRETEVQKRFDVAWLYERMSDRCCKRAKMRRKKEWSTQLLENK